MKVKKKKYINTFLVILDVSDMNRLKVNHLVLQISLKNKTKWSVLSGKDNKYCVGLIDLNIFHGLFSYLEKYKSENRKIIDLMECCIIT